MHVVHKLRAGAGIVIAALMAAAAAKSPSRRTVTVTEGTNVNVTVSPDRRTMILDLQEALWSLPLAGGKAKRLTESFLEAARPDWSPKGGLVAFQGYKGGTFHIWLMKPDGSGVRPLTDGHGDDRDPRFSPDGMRVAFSSDRAFKGNYDIWVADVQSGKLTQWTSAEADEYEPAWSPDGAAIAFVSGTGANGTAILSADAPGASRTLLTAPRGARFNSPTYSPDGKQLAYIETAGGKSRMMAAGRPVGDAADVFPFAATWLSDKELLYTGDGKILRSTIGGETRAVPFEVSFEWNRPDYRRRAYDFDSAAPRPVKGIVNPALSPDGRRIAFGALNQIWVAEIGGTPKALTNDSYYKRSPAWSPDGTKIAFSSDKAGTADIYVYDLASNTERRITSIADSAELDPAWSPDGRKIAFNKQTEGTFIVDLATGGITEAVKPTFEPGRPSWSAGGKSISLAALRPYSRRFREGVSVIQTVELATGKVTLTDPAPYKSITTRGVDGPVYSPDGTRMAYVMDSYLWVRPVDANGLPVGEARPVNEEMTDSPTWSGDGKRLLYLSGGALRMVAADGSTPPAPVPLDLTYRREDSRKKVVVHAGRLWDGLGPEDRADIDITISGRRIQKVAAHSGAAHQGADVIDASGLMVMPGMWESHNHGYGGLPAFGDRGGRLWLAYGFTALQSQGETAYAALEVKESFAANARTGPRFFAGGELIDGERCYYAMAHCVSSRQQLQMEFQRAKALGYDNLKTYVRLPHEWQAEAAAFAHNTLGVWLASHYGLPGLLYGMDGMTHVSATSRWGYSYTRSGGGETYGDIRKLFAAANEFIVSTPFAASALYAADPAILDDPRIATLNPPWQQRTMTAQRDATVRGVDTGIRGGSNLRGEEQALLAIRRAGGTVVMGTDSPLAGLAILNHLALRAEVQYGFQPWEALQTVTLLPARAFGYGKDLGSIEPGKLADMVFVRGNPLKEIKDAANVERVMVDGRSYTIPELVSPFGAK